MILLLQAEAWLAHGGVSGTSACSTLQAGLLQQPQTALLVAQQQTSAA